jgi:hypothetical protein
MSNQIKFPFLKLVAKPYRIPDDLARELAAIVIGWGGLENVIMVDLEQLRMFEVARNLSDAMPGAFGAKLKLWRQSYVALYPTMKVYHDIVDDIFSKTRIVGFERHRIIHGWWRPDESDPNVFHVLPAMDRLRKTAYIQANVAYVSAVHEDIRKLSDAVWSLNASRQLHAVQGLLQPQLVPSGGRPVPPTPPTDEKPQPPPRSFRA